MNSKEVHAKRPRLLAVGQFFFRLVNRPRRLVPAFIGSILLGAFCFMLAENLSYFDSLYWAMVTAPTTGFGDISPKTDAGKMVYMTFMPLWFILTGFSIGLIIDRFRHDKNEITEAEQSWIMDGIARLAEQQNIELAPQPADTSTDHLC